MASPVVTAWMRMLVSCRNRSSPAAGFTLLEILMVLVLVGLVGGLVVPRVGVIYDNLVLRSARDDILQQVESLPWLALNAGGTIWLGNLQGPVTQPVALPEGWRVAVDPAVAYRTNGFCSGGMFSLSYQEQAVWRYRMNAPFCKPERVADVP